MAYKSIVRPVMSLLYCVFFFFQAEDGIRDLVRSRGLGDVYKRQILSALAATVFLGGWQGPFVDQVPVLGIVYFSIKTCLLYTSDAADERSSVDLGGRRIIKKKTAHEYCEAHTKDYKKADTI